jgi:outer membrane protein assembly factor BamD
MRRISIIAFLAILIAFTAACTNKKVSNPLANVGSKQPDKVLFDRAMDALKHNKYDVARMTLQTLINTYPDSEFIARAKLAEADSWYAEGGSTALQQAEIEYKDFITFFPNLPEAAEAQLKVANIHYQEMEKADRDITHARRAEDEYRALIQQYPDSKLVPEAKQRLLEVQEVLGEREYMIGHFYYMRQAYPAAIARLQTLVERYPLYSGADEAFFLLGQSYEGEIALLRQNGKVNEVGKSKMIEDATKHASAAYDRIIMRYPAGDRAIDAKDRLEALHQPVPRPTKAMMEQNKKEIASRHEPGMLSGVLSNFEKHPDVERATKVGEPTLVDPTPVNAVDIVNQTTRAMLGGAAPAAGGEKKVTPEIINGQPAPNQEPPRSDTPPPAETAAPPAAAGTQASAPADSGATSPAAAAPAGTPDTNSPASADPANAGAPGELKPNVADPNELKPDVQSNDPNALPPLQQSNEITNGGASASSADSKQNPDDLADISSSKKKKKKGLGKLNPF